MCKPGMFVCVCVRERKGSREKIVVMSQHNRFGDAFAIFPHNLLQLASQRLLSFFPDIFDENLFEIPWENVA